jgi:hypothetical protein
MNFAATMCENRAMRRRILFAIATGISFAVGFVACGLDESGVVSDGGSDVTVSDVVPDTPLDVTPGCLTLDASACVDAAIPSDFFPVAFSPSAQASCPGKPGDYQDAQAYTTGAAYVPGSCTCGCTVSGTYSCAGALATGSHSGSCDNTATYDAGNTATCFPTTQSDNNLSVGPVPTKSGSVVCDASAGAMGAVTVDAATMCKPYCTADFCGISAPFSRCIASTTNTTCPGAFQDKHTIAPPGAAKAQCDPCTTCTVVSNGDCTATVTPFKNNADCGTGALPNITANGTCQTLGGGNNALSFLYTPTVPDASCTPGAGSGTAVYSQSLTICCLP